MLLTIILSACNSGSNGDGGASLGGLRNLIPFGCNISPPVPYEPSPAELEQDQIYMLLAYGVVYKDWQTENRRGYNIGSILVDPSKEPGNQLLCWARNSVTRTRNGTQHGEVRLLTNYLESADERNARGLKLYTTLEPCAMCSGMMTLLSLKTTIYGQTDPGFGGAIERLTLNSHPLQQGNCPYPRGVQSVAAPLEIREQLDATYQKAGMPSITVWLTSAEARSFYEQATDQLAEFHVQFDENSRVLDQARAFLESVPAEYTAIPYALACPVP